MVDAMVAREQLRSVVERIERLEEEKKAIADDIRDVYAEAKANGFDTKILRQVVSLRKQDLTERQASLLTASLPAPSVRSAGAATRFTRRIATRIQHRMRPGNVRIDCVTRRQATANARAAG